MQLEKYWHPESLIGMPQLVLDWRGISGFFRHWQQNSILAWKMQNRKLDAMGDLMTIGFAQGDYVCETGMGPKYAPHP